jgi:hypothetical protein|tara:strand:+ start:40 stop:441 length:402 start_codon:yes stop_codon:yes gene_type:complete
MDKDKTKQVWYRFSKDLEQLNVDCVDLLSKCYIMLGQRPDAQQVVVMSKMLVDDLSRYYGSMEMEEVVFAFEQGIRHSESGGFVNVRNWNIWLKEYKAKAMLRRHHRQLTDYQKNQQQQKLIDETINKAKRLK